MCMKQLMNYQFKHYWQLAPHNIPPYHEIYNIFYQLLLKMGNLGCGKSAFQNPTSYNDILIIKQLKQTGDQLFVSSLEKYQDYVTNKNYHTLMKKLKMQLEEKRKSVHDNFMNDYSKNEEILKKGQLKYNQQLSLQVDNSAKQLYLISQTIDAIIKAIDNEFEESKSKHDELKNQWKRTVEKMMSNKKMKKEIKQDTQQQRYQIIQSSKIVQSLKIDENVKKIVSISEIPEQQLNEKEKEGVIQTEINAIRLKLERQMQKQRQKHQKQMQELKKQIIRNNMESNESLKAMTMQNEKKQQELMRLNESLNMKIKNLVQEIEEKDKQIQQLINITHPTQTNTDTKANSQKRALLNTVQTTQSNLKDSFRKKSNDDFVQSFSRSVTSSQIQGKFQNSKVISVRHKNGISYRTQIDHIFNPIHIYASTIMFNFDHVRPNNMDEYVKDEKDLLFVAKLQNGMIIGGFSKNGFKASTEDLSKNLCFIFSIHPNGTYYKLQLKCQGLAMHSVKLDSRFLKFGSNEIRVSCGKLEGICNVSTSSCIFESKDEKASPSLKDFIGTSSESFKIKHCEIFKLHLKYPQIQPTDEGQTKFNPFLSQIAA